MKASGAADVPAGDASLPEPVPLPHDLDRVTLHEEVADILRARSNSWMSTAQIAAAVNARGRYHKKDGTAVTPFQVHGRTKNYESLFERNSSLVRLRT